MCSSDLRWHAGEVVGRVVEGHVAALDDPGLEVEEVARDVGVVVEAVDQEQGDRPVPGDVRDQSDDWLDDVVEARGGHIGAEGR